jgi:hypothetical protein
MAEFKSDTVVLHRNELECTVCHELSIDTMCLPSCMHVVCTECHAGMSRAAPRMAFGMVAVACPSCRAVGAWIKNVQVNRIVGTMRVGCEYKCNVDVAFSDYPKHKNECLQRPAKCPHQDCEWSGTWAERLTHVDECEDAVLACPHCCCPVHRGAFDDHVKTCNYCKVTCAECHKVFVSWKLKRHKCVPPTEERKEEEAKDAKEDKVAKEVACGNCGLTRDQTRPAMRDGLTRCSQCHRWGARINIAALQPVPDIISRANMELEWQHLHEQLQSPFCTDEEKDGTRMLIEALMEEAHNYEADEPAAAAAPRRGRRLTDLERQLAALDAEASDDE